MSKAAAIFEAVDRAEKIVITSHRSPDGDSMGSSAALYHVLTKMGKDAVVCHPDHCPAFLEWVMEDCEWYTHELVPDKVEKFMSEADLIFCLDYNGPDRMGNGMADLLRKSDAFKIMLDHHPHPDNFVHIAESRITEGSTCQILFDVIEEAGKLSFLDISSGEAIYLGIMTDTGAFRFSSVNPKTHEIIAHLMRIGVNNTAVHERTFDNVRIDRLRLQGYAISNKLEIIQHYHIAYISLTEEELNRFHYKKGDTDGLVNMALSVEGIKVAAFFSEKDGQIKISFRSKGTIPVNGMAKEFNGGGHVNAAGGASQESMEDTIKHFKALIPKYFNGLNAE